MLNVIDQTERRIIEQEKVPAVEKIVSIFEEHTDVIVKGFRDIQYEHKINLASDQHGFITYLSIESGRSKSLQLSQKMLKMH